MKGLIVIINDKWTPAADKYRFYCDKTAKRGVGDVSKLLQANAHKQKTIQRKNWFHSLKFYVLRHPSKSHDVAAHNLHLLPSLQHFIDDEHFIYAKEMNAYLKY